MFSDLYEKQQLSANVAIDILIVDLISANPIELFGNRAEANTNLSGTEWSIIKLNRTFDCVTIKITHNNQNCRFFFTERKRTPKVV